VACFSKCMDIAKLETSTLIEKIREEYKAQAEKEKKAEESASNVRKTRKPRLASGPDS
jgi:hypothetical protein